MKSLLLFASAMVIYSFSYSQVSKGTCLLGGDVSLSVTSDDQATSSNFTYTVIPDFGYMFSNNWEVGLGLGVNGNTMKTGGDPSTQNFQFDIQPFVSYYHPFRENSKFYCRAIGAVNLGFGTFKAFQVPSGTLEDENTSTSIGIGISPGIAWAPVKHFMFAADYGNLSYSVATTKFDEFRGGPAITETDTVPTFGFNLNPSSLNFSFDYLF